MKTFLLVVLVVVAFIFALSCSESGREIKAEQLQKRGDDLYYAVNEENPYSGKVVELYESGQKKNEGTFKNGKLHGLTTTWDSHGQKKSEVSFQNGVQSGPYRTWYDNGQQEKEGAYKDGKEDGKWVFWYDNGQKQRECNYQDGVLDGRWVSWYEKGKQEKEGAYKDGKEDGKWVYYYDNGQRQSEGEYKEGKRQAGWNFWTKDGQKRETDTVTDIDGNTYLVIKIGEQWWMAENLKVTRYRNGDPIPNVTDKSAWAVLTTGACCSYENDPANAETYGHLYNWYAVNDSRGLAPEGWHIPGDAEWQTLVDHLGGESVAGGKLKETAGWSSPNRGATNESGFSALPGGYRYGNGGFLAAGLTAHFWSSTENSRYSAWLRTLDVNHSEVYRNYNYKRYGFSVRCVRD